MCPYKAAFGVDPYIGLEKLNLTKEQEDHVASVKDLCQLVTGNNVKTTGWLVVAVVAIFPL
jgi:hypothetical protein